MSYVYVITACSRYKIGRTDDPDTRFVTLQCPEVPRLVCMIRTNHPVGMERHLHGRFAHVRRHGEWFELSGEDVLALRTGTYRLVWPLAEGVFVEEAVFSRSDYQRSIGHLRNQDQVEASLWLEYRMRGRYGDEVRDDVLGL